MTHFIPTNSPARANESPRETTSCAPAGVTALRSRPPRRHPRVLGVASAPGALAVACVDPWGVRTAQRLQGEDSSALALQLAAAVSQERPTVIAVCRDAWRGLPWLQRSLERAHRMHQVPIATVPLERLCGLAGMADRRKQQALAQDVVQRLYPDLARTLDPTRDRAIVRAVAVAWLAIEEHTWMPRRVGRPRGRSRPPL